MTNFSSALGLVLIVVYVVVAIMGAIGATPFPSDRPTRDRLQAPSLTHLMGTDMLGRDVASRIMKGATNSLRVAALSVLLSGVIGSLIGIVAGYWGGLADTIIMRSTDVIFAFPALLLALLVIAVLGPGLNSAIIAITIVYTPIFARVARGPVLSLKAVEYVTAARCIGARHLSILFRHILPNMTAPLIVQFSLALSWALLTETSLSFIGLGTQPPDASWGVMLNESRAIADRAPWLIFFAGAAIVLGVLGFSLLGDGMRDVLDPKMRKRV
ncbi:MAG: ABC transporter permease [Anaerolineae bacterium]|nr:ABC transporter permease [Anaerolineae bacterium]